MIWLSEQLCKLVKSCVKRLKIVFLNKISWTILQKRQNWVFVKFILFFMCILNLTNDFRWAWWSVSRSTCCLLFFLSLWLLVSTRRQSLWVCHVRKLTWGGLRLGPFWINQHLWYPFMSIENNSEQSYIQIIPKIAHIMAKFISFQNGNWFHRRAKDRIQMISIKT